MKEFCGSKQFKIDHCLILKIEALLAVDMSGGLEGCNWKLDCTEGALTCSKSLGLGNTRVVTPAFLDAALVRLALPY